MIWNPAEIPPGLGSRLSRAVALPVSLLLLGACATKPPGPPAVPVPPAAEVRPQAPAVASPPATAEAIAPPRPPAAIVAELPTIPETVRVGLATDLAELSFPAAGNDVEILADGQRLARATALRIVPAPGSSAAGSYRLQVAALKDEGQARGLADGLSSRTGEPAAVVFDAGRDLYRVRIGNYPDREAAEQAQQRLGQHNVHDSFVVGEEGELERPALRIVRGDDDRTVPGRWLVVKSANGEGVSVLERRFRGELLIYLNDRGTLNVINQVSLANYLRGVVPREMGPKIYDNLDALKAQAVAARTYALKNMGEFAAEGYDICATPRCQAYGGMDWEQELTDRAVAETAGEVLIYQGELADSLYSSTCGGHTEDVEVVFPLKNEPYLRGVPCLEAGVVVLESTASSRLSLPARMAHILVPPETGAQAEMVGRRLTRLAKLAGLTTPRDRLASIDRRELQRFIGSQFDLALDARLFMARADVDYLLDHPPSHWSEEDLHLAAFLKKSGLLGGPLDQPLETEEIEETIFRLAIFLRILEQREVRFQSLDGDRLTVRAAGESTVLTVPARVSTYRQRGDQAAWAPLRLVAGDRLSLFLRGGALQAVLQDVDPDGLGYDRTSNLSSWTHFRSDRELAERVESRYPDLEFAGFELLSRGVSGRVGEMRLLDRNGQDVLVRGLPIRWTLDLPDNLFTARRLEPSDGEPGWLFSGRGWGHGVGMCQVGAYGMGLRGHSYDRILSHYYTGLELVRLESAEAAASGSR